jgi:hypothetical protein
MTTDEANTWLDTNRHGYPWVIANMSGQVMIGLPCPDGVMLYHPANLIEKAADLCIQMAGATHATQPDLTTTA